VDRADNVNVLIAGGGVAALEAALALRALAGDRVRVELCAPEPRFWYRPLAVAEPFALGEVRNFDLSQLAAEMGATFSPGELLSVDTERRIAYIAPGGPVAYSMLLIACGAVPKSAIDGAVTFRGPADTVKVERLLTEIEAGGVERIAFAVPAGAVWSLPAYELALLTARWLTSRGLEGKIALAVVTPEEEPLHLFGREASGAVRALLEERGIAVHTNVYPAEARVGELLLVGGGVVAADRVVALPRLEGPRIGGIPQTFEGFIPVDLHGRVAGLAGVYAAGDITTFSVKQGGIAAQQADAAAQAIAAEAGADVAPEPFRPVLRGLLLTGAEPRYLRGELAGGAGETSEVSLEPLWWPPAKIVGHYLAPFLARLAGTLVPAEPMPEAGVSLEVELEEQVVGQLRRDRILEAAIDEAFDESSTASVGDVMSEDPLVVAPEDTLGQVAEKMAARDIGSALVADYGRLIGILTSRDMLRALAGRVHSSEARVREWMTAEPIAVSATTSVGVAAVLMTEHHIHHLPVVEGERPVGMVGMRDIVRSAKLVGWPTGIGLGF
jgi:sulfide:quinone oxidoreductase